MRRKDGLVRHEGKLYCGACGMLAQPGDEEFDWCDHRTGRGCAYMQDDGDEEFDWCDHRTGRGCAYMQDDGDADLLCDEDFDTDDEDAAQFALR